MTPTAILLLLRVLQFPVHQISASKVSAIIAFGDSFLDSGNNNQIPTTAKSNFMPYGRDFFGRMPTGRFSDGRLPSDIISEAFGLKPAVPAYLDPTQGIKDFATGVCFASAASGLDNATSDVRHVIPLWKQVEYYEEYTKKLAIYTGQAKADLILNEALHLVSIGTNDFIENYYLGATGRSLQFAIGEFQDFLIRLATKFVNDIYRLGARKITFLGLPPLGCLPIERSANIVLGRACIEKINEAAKNFNANLQVLLQRLNMELPGITLVYVHVYDVFLEIIRNPSVYGFEKVTVGCCGTGLFEVGPTCNESTPFTCRDANKYVFWDSVHPTQRMNGITANVINTTLARFL